MLDTDNEYRFELVAIIVVLLIMAGAAFYFAKKSENIDLDADTIDPVVSEYQKMAMLQRADPLLSDIYIAINGQTAIGCNEVMNLNEQMELDAVTNLVAYFKNTEDKSSDTYFELLGKAAMKSCQVLISNKVQAMRSSFEQLKPSK